MYLCLRSTRPSLNNSIFQQEQKYHENEIWILLLLFVFVVHCLSLPPKLVGGYMHYVASSAVPGLQTPYIFKASGFWPIEEQSLILKLSLFEKWNKCEFSNQFPTELQINSKSALEESQVCIAIAGLYINLTGLSWCYLKVTGPLWIKMLIEKIYSVIIFWKSQFYWKNLIFKILP